MDPEEQYSINQFVGTNFPNWKFRIQILLQKHGVEDCLSEVPPTDIN